MKEETGLTDASGMQVTEFLKGSASGAAGIQGNVDGLTQVNIMTAKGVLNVHVQDPTLRKSEQPTLGEAMKGKHMKKENHNDTVYELKDVLNLSFKVTNCCKSLSARYSFQKAYMTGLVSSPPHSAMSRRNSAHNPPSQPKETSTGRDAPQEEAIRKFAMQLRHIGDSIQHRMVQEDLQQEGREALAHVVLLVYRRVQVMFRFFWNNHLL
ncbi:peroxisomal testis-specific protein 1 [Perognathus longimembris pacificus]|uniref:peroxisomal testis-specific protein 1 n=1 Tax=Perognathus longimembris pacificus TaxID=214514 RepID=UPI0020193786|nr:peroxisomal testis-specific protein 1 [Perognathus longimembris pacificus]